MLVPTIFIARGNEAELSESLKKKALEIMIGDTYYSLYADTRGKPYVECPTQVGISVTHSAGVVAVGVFPFEPVGIDMEKIAEDFPARVADRFFTSEEREKIHSPRDFYKTWCRKESYVKMTGEGISAISSFNSEKTSIVLTDLEDRISQALKENFAFSVASETPIEKIKIVQL